MKHPFERYFRKHGHYPRLRFDNGVQRLTIEFAPGYVRIKTSSPFAGEVYIVRSTWLKLLSPSVKIARMWQKHSDFDVPAATHQSHLAEMEHLQALREQKKNRKAYDFAAQEAKKKARYEAAKRRARRLRQPET